MFLLIFVNTIVYYILNCFTVFRWYVLKANQRIKKLRQDDRAVFEALPTLAFAVVMLFAILFIGTYMTGTIASNLVDNFGDSGLETRARSTMVNLSTDYDDVVDIVTVAALITVLTFPLMAIVAIKRLI